MKKYFILSAVAALALASCTSDEYLGDADAVGQTNNGAIKFSSKTTQATRANYTGLEAAAKLNLQFYVSGFKGGTLTTVNSVVTTTVFDQYKVEWGVNSAGTTASNTSDWEYVGKGPGYNSGASSQEIKYWDFAAGQYDFIAYSPSTATVKTTGTPSAGELVVTPITAATATSATGGAYTVTGATADLAKFYIADLVTAYNPNNTSTDKPAGKPVMGNEVTLTFRNLTSKVRIGLYETVPGYSIRDVEFYASDAATEKVTDDVATLYSAGNTIFSNGTYTVYYPTVDKNMNDDGKQATDYNKAHVAFAPATSGSASTVTFGATGDATLTYTRDQATTAEAGGKYLGITSNDATYITADKADAYTSVLPNENATALTLRVNYTLVSNDKSKETIKVWGAKAVVPAQYCQWKSNYAYTYLFKISDATNGNTQALGLGQAGLTPITFDAVVSETEDGVQETITTVATPSITTYSPDPSVQPSAMNEYKTGSTVYVMVQDGATLKGDLATKGKLYKVTTTGTEAITEATVMDALNMNDGATPMVGRNGIKLEEVTAAADFTTIPGADGNNITITAGQAASFTTGTSGTVYAYAYDFTATTATPSYLYTAQVLSAEPSDWGTSGLYFTDPDGVTAAPTTFAAGTYYKKLTNNGNSYAVKVIRVQ